MRATYVKKTLTRRLTAKSTDGGLTFSKPQLLCEITPLPDNHIYADDDAGDTDVRVLRLRDLRDRFEVQGITRVNNDPPGSDQFSRSSRSRRTGGPTRLDR